MLHRPILIMAGGTGGHVFPALAVADYLRDKGIPVFWLGTKAGLESRVVTKNGFQLLTIDVRGIRGKAIKKWFSAPFMLLHAIYQAIVILIRIKPAVVLGMGGFASGPGGIAAWLLRVPLLIHEQNSIAGFTNYLLAPFAKIIMQGFPGTFKSNDKVYTTGNPVRKTLSELPEPEVRYSERLDSAMRLLIIGGSLGAKALNEIVPAALGRLQDDIDIEVWHQTGEQHYESTFKFYQDLDRETNFRVNPFIEDMASAYTWADIVLCRAGALTIAELSLIGVASILVPFPYAVDDHQTANARHLSEKGGAILISELELEENSLASLLTELAKAPQRLLDMARNSKLLSHPEATKDVAERCLEVIHV